MPHLLREELRAKHKEFAGRIIPYLEAVNKDGWKHLVTGDELRLFLSLPWSNVSSSQK
jgi:hypothetical protein